VSLEPGVCRNQRVLLQGLSLPEGEWVLGALADPFENLVEGSESNNARAGASIAIGYKPDLVLTELRGPVSTPTHTSFPVTFTACNQGTSPTLGSRVEFYQSHDATITSSDVLLGGASLPSLAEGECITRQVQVSSSGPTGAWFLGAIADPFNSEPEFFESNNARLGELFGVGSGPDLVVRALSAPRSVSPGRLFELTATVCNQGTGSSSNAPLEVMLSLDGTIDTSDWRLVGMAIPSLTPDECRDVTVSTSASAPHGVYVLGAIVDPGGALFDLNRPNNAFAGPRFGVGDAPDLVVTSVRAPPHYGGALTGPSLVTVCNWGTLPSTYGFQVDMVRSSDDTITLQDWRVGNTSFPGLAPNECVSREVSTNVSGPEGTWYIGAIIDATGSVPELSEDNNTGASTRVGVGFRPDYVVKAVSGPPGALPGAPFAVTMTLCNEGNDGYSGGAPIYVNVVRSPDATIDLSDRSLGSTSFPSLPRGQCVTQTSSVSMAGPNGPAYLGAIIDVPDIVVELFEDNNTGVGNRLSVGSAPDLVVRVVGSLPPSAQVGQSIRAQLEVCNQGTQATSGSIAVDLVQSPDATVTFQDKSIGGFSMPQLSSGQCRSVFVNGYVSGPEGLYTLGALVDAPNFVAELLEDNNLATSGVLAVGLGPDYVISSLSAPSSVQAGPSFTVTVTVCNQGTKEGFGTLLKVFQSNDANVTVADPRITESSVPALSPGQCTPLSLAASAFGPNGTYTLGAIVDPGNSQYELRENNNVHVGGRLGVGSKPDLVVTQVSGPMNVAPGASFQASVTVCNQGTAPSGNFSTDVALSEDTTIDFQDFRWGGGSMSGLAPGQCTVLNLPVTAYVPDGPYYLGAITDSMGMQEEMFEDNNASAGPLMGVGHAPDLNVTAFSSPGLALPGTFLRTRMTVCNQGTTSSPSHEVAVFQSSDATVTPQDFLVGRTWVPALASGQCALAEVSGPTNGSEGSYVLGASADPQGQVFETLEGNNLSTASLMLVAKADLTVTAISGATNTRRGVAFTSQVTTCNVGTKASFDTITELRLSTDDFIGPGDTVLTQVTFPAMEPGQCLTFQVNASAYVPDGLYWLGAWVNPNQAQGEAREDNNTLVGNMLAVSAKGDLTVAEVLPPMNVVSSGAPFSASVRVCNVGVSSTSSTRLELFLSADNRIMRGEDFLAADVPFTSLAAGTCRIQSVTATTGSVFPGRWVLGAIVDGGNLVIEANESNNTLAGEPMAVGNGADLAVTSVSPPTNVVLPGTSFKTDVQVCNRGSASTPSSQVEVFLSRDATVTREDFSVGGAPLGSLVPGACLSVSVFGTASAGEGTWFVGAIADPFNNFWEPREDNNTRAGASLAVGDGPNLLVTSVSGPSVVRPGAPFTTSTMVCNRGTRSSPPSTVTVHLSGDASIGPGDLKQGQASVPGLSAGTCITLSVPGQAYGPEGALFTLGAVVDPGESVFEPREDDNAWAGGAFRIDGTPPATPSITSTSPNGQGTTTMPGVYGTAEANATVRLYTNSTCTGTVAKMGTASTTGSFSLTVTVPANSTTTFYAQAADAAGNVSGCSAGRAYTHDGIAPSTPVLSGTNPSSPGTSTTPAFQGSAEPNTTVRLYTTSTCTGTVAASGSSGTSGAFSLTVTVAADTTTTVYASSADAAGNVSACSAGLSYTHSSL
jgi:subtilase family serine protease